MKQQRRNRLIYHNLKLFAIVFLSIMLVGAIALGVLFCKNRNDKELLVYEFFQLPETEIDKFANTSLEAEMDMNKEIYENAVQNHERVKMIPCVEEDGVSLLFAGDILLDDQYAMMSNFVSRGRDYEATFANGLLEEMKYADIFMINNEFTFTDRGTALAGKKYTFRSQTRNVSFLHDIGVDIVSLANNHTFDFGEVSLLDTLDTLEKNDIPYVGAGRNLEEAMQPYYLVANGMKIAFVSGTQLEKYSNPETKGATTDAPGTLRCVDPSNLLQCIETAEKNADFTILFIHWGTESQEWIDEMQKEQADIYTKAGVDLIIGAHPHVLQKIEYVNDVPVVYSLGNFWFNSKDRDTGVVKVVLKDKHVDSLQFLPCKQMDCKTFLLDQSEKSRVLSYMQQLSTGVVFDQDGIILNKN